MVKSANENAAKNGDETGWHSGVLCHNLFLRCWTESPFFAFRAIELPTLNHSLTYPVLTTQLTFCSPNTLCSLLTGFLGIPWLEGLPALPGQF